MYIISTFTSTTHSSPQAEPPGAIHRTHKAQVPQWLKFTLGLLLAVGIFSTDLAGKNLRNSLLGGTYTLATPVDGGPPCSGTPTAYTVTGGGTHCAGGTGVVVGLENSETDVNYQLRFDGSDTGSPVAGTGAVLSSVNQTAAGTYTVVATNTVGGCTANMSGSAIITAGQAILYVKTAATGTGDGSSWANASADLQGMLAAPYVQEIWVAAGTYYPTATTDQGIFFNLPSGVKLYGGFNGTESMLSERDVAANPTILSGNIGNPGVNNDNSDRVIVVSNGAAGTRIDGFTISDANNDYTNGAVNVGNSTLDIAFCTFLNNTAYAGGGLGFSNSTVNIDHCLFHDNYGAAGGGAISSNDGTLIVTNTIFRNNNGGDSGGAFFSQSSPNASFTNCLFYRNSVNFFDGSAIFSGGTIALSHCTVVGNTNRRALALLGTGTAKNCIVWGNPAGGFGGSAITVNNSITQNNANTGTGNVSQDPLFADAADPDGADNIWGTSDDGLVPRKCSPAIDAAAAPYHATDLAGNSPQDAPGIGISPADMGAYEQQDVDYPAVVTDISVTVPTAFEDNGTICTFDDTFLGDVTVTFANFTSTGTLTVTSDHIVTPVTPVAMGSTTTSTSHTFSGVSMRADNGAITVAASISDAPCSLTKTNLGTALGTGLGYVECTDCGTKWYDLGGPTGNYPNESQTKTFCPQTTDHKAQLEFVSLQLAAEWDALLIYDGYNTNGNEVAYLNSESSPATYTATNPTGCLTAAFFSYTNNEAAGWEANFNCVRIYKIESSNISSCTNNSTSCPDDDTYTADITIYFASLPTSGTLNLSGGDIVGTPPAPVPIGDLSGGSYTFTGVTLRADGNPVILTAQFSEETSNALVQTMDNAPAACSSGGTYTPSSITVSGFDCFGPNGNYQPSGTINGAPFWSSDYGAGLYRIAWAVTRWEIQDAEGTPYAIAANTNGSITNLPCSGGWTDPNEVDCIDTPITLIGGCGDLSVPAGPACDIIGMSIGNMGNCNDNGTTDGTDDYFVAGDVAVGFAYAPGSGDLVLKRGNIVLATKSAAELSCTTEWYFLNVQMVADGQPLDLTAEFTDCALTQNFGNAPASCSCVPTSAFTTCPLGATANVAPNSCAATATYTAAANGDPAPTYAYEFTGATIGTGSGTGSGASFSKGLTNVKVTATNDCGSAICQFTVTVTDNIAPAINCPSPITVNTAAGQCGNNATWTPPVGTDNCPGANTLGSHAPNAFFGKGQTTVIYTVTDAAGLTSACSFTITIGDNQAPVLDCPTNITRPSTLGCGAPVSYAPTVTDNCPGATVTLASGLASGAIFPVGTTSVTLRVSDGAALTATCSFTVTVNDAQAPVITCPANLIRSNDGGQCRAVVTYAQPTATDNCGTASVTLQSAPNTASGSNFPIGTTTTVVWRASDTATPLANTATCAFTITVIDTQAPTIACPANMSVGNAPGLCTALVSFATPSGSDNCPLPPNAVMQTSGPTTGMSFPKGQTTVVFRVTDAVGLTKTCSFRVTVNDTQAPMISCPTVAPTNTAANACSSAAVIYATPTAIDNCTPVPTVVRIGGPASGSTFSVGTTVVTWRAIDGAGRSATCTFAVTVTDNTPPTISCPPNIVQNNPPNACNTPVNYTTPTATDNCGVNAVYLLTGLVSGSAFPLGTTAVTWRAADNNGASSACTFTVTVNCGTAKPGDDGAPVSHTQISDAQTADTPTSQVLKIWETSEQALESVLDLSLAPNPAATQVRFKVSGLGEKMGELLIFDGLGRIVLRQVLAPEQNDGTFEVSDLPEGLYRVSLRMERRVVTKGLVVNKR